jgi:hypothetical protein
MNTQKIKIASILMIMFFAIGITGCSENSSPVSGPTASDRGELSLYPDYKDVTFELGLDILPFGEKSVSASELGVVYFTSLELRNASEFESIDAADFCDRVIIQTDYPGDVEYKDCNTGDIKAGKIIITNNSKRRMNLIAVLKCKSLFGVVEKGK